MSIIFNQTYIYIYIYIYIYVTAHISTKSTVAILDILSKILYHENVYSLVSFISKLDKIKTMNPIIKWQHF